MLIKKLSSSLLIDAEHLAAIGTSASRLYREYSIPKRNGQGQRTIHHPTPELKLVQRWLAIEIINKFPVHKAVKSYLPDTSIRNNAEIHAASKFLLRMDFKAFFPSIVRRDIELFMATQNGNLPDWWTPRDVGTFCDFVCRWDRLTIGAPSSPSLTNSICYNLDEKLEHLSKEYDVAYSRYADDLFFSTTKPHTLYKLQAETEKLIKSLEYPARLRINRKKTINFSKKRHREVTGLVITSVGAVSIGRKKKRYIRHLIHKYATLDENNRQYLKGYLAYTKSVEPKFINRLYVKYGPDIMNAIIGK